MRRMNCGFVGFTQSSVEITESPDCNLLLGNMPGKLFFPDDSAATPIVATLSTDSGSIRKKSSRIAGAQIGEFFYKSSLGSRLASAWLGPSRASHLRLDQLPKRRSHARATQAMQLREPA